MEHLLDLQNWGRLSKREFQRCVEPVSFLVFAWWLQRMTFLWTWKYCWPCGEIGERRSRDIVHTINHAVTFSCRWVQTLFLWNRFLLMGLFHSWCWTLIDIAHTSKYSWSIATLSSTTHEHTWVTPCTYRFAWVEPPVWKVFTPTVLQGSSHLQNIFDKPFAHDPTTIFTHHLFGARIFLVLVWYRCLKHWWGRL